MAIFDWMPSDAWLWLAGSLLLAVFWKNLTWLFSPWVEAERSTDEFGSLAERIVVRVATWRFASATLEALRLFYYVGIPFAALFWGRDAIVGRLFGLQRLLLPVTDGGQQSAMVSRNWFDWLQDCGWAAALGLGSWGVLLLAGWTRRRALSQRAGAFAQNREASAWETIREAAYHEIHWAFYRNAPIVTFGLYRGTWFGLGLVAVEALANPLWRRGLSDPGRAPRLLLRAALGVVSSVLFLKTQNLWLALVLHALVSRGLEGIHSLSPSGVSEGLLAKR